jgi:acetyl-CoA acyltransferase 1
MTQVAIVSVCRTPLRRRAKKGQRRSTSEALIKSAVAEVLLRVPDISRCPPEDVAVGNVLGGAAASVTARTAVVKGLKKALKTSPSSSLITPIRLVNRQCASGLQAIADIANQISTGEISCGLALGFESMSYNTMAGAFATPPDIDSNDEEDDGCDPDDLNSLSTEAIMTPMGITSENVAKKYGITRQEQDEFSVRSHKRAAAAWLAGKFDYECVPPFPPSPPFPDNGIRPGTSIETLSKLPPAFTEDGSTTAANSSQITDGCACVLLMSVEMTKVRMGERGKRHLPPLLIH